MYRTNKIDKKNETIKKIKFESIVLLENIIDY